MVERLTKDERGDGVQAFTFRTAMASGTTLTPSTDLLVHISADVDITVDSVTCSFVKGDKIILVVSTEYTFSESISLGVS